MLVAQLTMDEIFTCTKKFKQEVFSSVQKELDQFSLFIYNATVKQLVDVPGHEYFSYLGEKTQQEAASRAKVHVCGAGWPHVPERRQGGRRDQGVHGEAPGGGLQGGGQGDGGGSGGQRGHVKQHDSQPLSNRELDGRYAHMLNDGTGSSGASTGGRGGITSRRRTVTSPFPRRLPMVFVRQRSC